MPLATKLANAGYRVVLHDRRNTGRSDVLIEGDVAEEILWLDDLHELLKQLNAIPTFIGGSSAGARTAMRYYIRFRNDVRGLLLMRVTGGAFAAGRLPENYYGQFIKAAQEGGMAAVCATEQYQERIAANPQTRDRLMAMDPKQYIKVMSNWQDQFIASTKTEVFGMTDADLAAISVPTVVIPGNDQTHASVNGRIAARNSGQRAASTADRGPGGAAHQLYRMGAPRRRDRADLPRTDAKGGCASGPAPAGGRLVRRARVAGLPRRWKSARLGLGCLLVVEVRPCCVRFDPSGAACARRRRSACARAAEPVDLLLVFAADVSRSIDQPKFQLQREGYAAAIADKRVLEAITAGRNRRIAVAFVEWSGVSSQKVVIDWTVIDGARRRARNSAISWSNCRARSPSAPRSAAASISP